MIRRVHGDSFLLIAQHDHALAAAEVAKHIGNAMFAPPNPFDEVIGAIALHDAGWPIHDADAPTLNARGEPLHVLETPVELATRVWSESVRRATAAKGLYAGLLVSLHVTALSNYVQSLPALSRGRATNSVEHFLLNKFQQQQFEFHEKVRRQLKMRLDVALANGLAEPGVDEAEDLLLFNYNLLKAMDRISLDLCCSEKLFQQIDDVYPKPGESPVTIRIRHDGDGAMSLSPWPFAVETIEVSIPGRRVPRKTYASEQELRDVLRAASVEQFNLRVSAR